MSHPAHDCCESAPRKGCARKGWARRPLPWVALAAMVLYLGGFFLPVLRPFQGHFLMYLKMVWWALGLGLLLGGLIDRYIPSEYISKILAHRKKRTIFYATGLGLLMSACSHGILAIGMELHKKGASGPAVISFLLGSPWANLPVTLLLLGLFHAKGLLIILSAIFVSIVTGLVFRQLDRLGWIDSNPHTTAVAGDFSVIGDLKRRRREKVWNLKTASADARAVWDGTLGLADMILWWILLGIILAGLIGAYVPSSLFTHYLAPTLTGLLLTLAAATVIEICSEGSAPLAFEIYRQTGALGNTFAFLMGGFVTDYTEIGLIGTNLGWRTAFWMVLTTVPQVILIGWISNQIF